jgi:hypothetical protein
VGNAAGDGARIACSTGAKRAEAQELAHTVRYIETAVAADFQDEFVGAIHIPHASDPYPHLADHAAGAGGCGGGVDAAADAQPVSAPGRGAGRLTRR